METIQNIKFDHASKESILAHARGLDGKTLHELYPKACEGNAEAAKGKGKIGVLVEQFHFGIESNNESRPDFPEASLELKTTAVTKRKDREVSAKERLSLGMIDYKNIIHETFYTSAFLKKNAYLLIMVYVYEKNQTPCRNRFMYSFIYTIPDEDKSQILQDWTLIREKVRHGDAHDLSESDTLYLAAATKGASSSDVTSQPRSSQLAKRRAFCFKRSYLDYVVKTHLGFAQARSVSIGSVTNADGDENSLEDVVIERCSEYFGMDTRTLFQTFGMKTSKAKNWASMLVRRMLGMDAKDEITEFLKAGVNVKAVTTTDGRRLKEAMSFAQIDYEAVVNEDWETSYWGSVISNKFLVMVFDRDTSVSETIFKGAFFWSLPNEAQEEAIVFWNDIRLKIEQEQFPSLYSLKSPKYYHVRPKAENAADVRVVNGKRVKKMAYWINRKVVRDELLAQGYLLHQVGSV